jgi:hypothetical protein
VPIEEEEEEEEKEEEVETHHFVSKGEKRVQK